MITTATQIHKQQISQTD